MGPDLISSLRLVVRPAMNIREYYADLGGDVQIIRAGDKTENIRTYEESCNDFSDDLRNAEPLGYQAEHLAIISMIAKSRIMSITSKIITF